MSTKTLTILDVADLMLRIKDQEQYRAEGLILFRDCLSALDMIGQKTTQAEKSAIINTTIEALNEYLKNIIEYNVKQDELLKKVSDLTEVEEMGN